MTKQERAMEILKSIGGGAYATELRNRYDILTSTMDAMVADGLVTASNHLGNGLFIRIK